MKSALRLGLLGCGLIPLVFGCRTRSLNNAQSSSNQSDEDKFSYTDKDWINNMAKAIESGISKAPPYTFVGFDGKLCKKAFDQSSLADDEEQNLAGSLVGILHYLEDWKQKAEDWKYDATKNQEQKELVCTTVDRLRTPFLGVVNGIFKRDPNVVSKKAKQEKIESSAAELNVAKICVSKHNALILRIEDMIQFYVDGYDQSLKKPAKTEMSDQQATSSLAEQQAAQKKLANQARFMLLALENPPSGSPSLNGVVKMWSAVSNALELHASITALIDSNPSLKFRYAAPNITDGFRDFRHEMLPTSQEMYNKNELRYDAMVWSGRDQLKAAYRLYDEFLKQLGDMEPGTGTTLELSPLLKSCSKFKISQR